MKKKYLENFIQQNGAVMQKAKVEYIKHLHLEEIYWKQKVGYDCFKLVKERRNKIKISRILNNQGSWIENDKWNADEAVSFYQRQFTQEREDDDLSLLRYIPEFISDA